MKRVAISGYYGFNNLGDEAVLEAILKNIRGSFPDAEITVFSATPEETARQYGVRSVGRTAPFGILKTLAWCDVLVSGGGSLLQDVTGHLSVLYYLSLIAVAKLMGKRAMVYSQGIGPIRKRVNRLMTRLVLNQADAITVREPKSRADLVEIGVPSNRIIVTADPVISLRCNPEGGGTDHLPPRSGGKTLRIGLAFRGQDLRFKADEKLAEAIGKVRERLDVQVVLVPYYRRQDLPMVERLESILGESVCSVRSDVRVQEMIDLTAELDVLVGSRLHSLIIAAVCPTPMVAVSYDPKIEYFMETVNQRVAADVRDIDSDALAEAIIHAVENKAAICSDLQSRVEKLSLSLGRNEAILGELLNDRVIS